MNLMSLIDSGISSMKNSSDDCMKKQKILKDQYVEKKTYDVKIKEIRHGVSWSRDLLALKN